MLVFPTRQLTGPRYIINFPTKRHWKGRSRLEDIESGLAALVEEVRSLRIRSLAIPPLGCGLGGLNWSDVRRRIEKAFEQLPDVEAVVFEPVGSPPQEELPEPIERPRMTPGRAALLGLMQRYLAGLMDPFVSLLEVHKLMYFLQEAGQPLRLRFVKAPYGPYAENLRHVLQVIEGHFVVGYEDGGDDPTKPLELVPGAAAEALVRLNEDPPTLERFERVAKLVEGFETPFGMELLSSVHWVIARERAATPEALVAQMYGWNPHKRRFSPDQILLAQRVLHSGGWLAPEPPSHVPAAPPG